jgi:hypothetical protein
VSWGGFAYADCIASTYGNGYVNSNSNSNSNSGIHAYSYGNSHSHSYSYSDIYTYADANAGNVSIRNQSDSHRNPARHHRHWQSRR